MDAPKYAYVEVGQRISDLRREKERVTGRKVTQRDVAKIVGVSVGTVTAWEIGKQRPEGENLVKLARFLSTSPALIVGEVEVRPDVVAVPGWLQQILMDDARAAVRRADGFAEMAAAARLAEENARDRRAGIFSLDPRDLRDAALSSKADELAQRHLPPDDESTEGKDRPGKKGPDSD